MTDHSDSGAIKDRTKSVQTAAQRIAARVRGLWGWAQRTRPYRTFSHFTDVGGSVLSAGMSYQALFAVFAALWIGFGFFGAMLSDRPELLETLIEQINLAIPGLIGNDENSPVHPDTLLAVRALNWTSVIAAVALVWVTLNWFTGTRRSIRLIFGLDVKQYRNAVLLKLRDFLLAVLFAVALVVSAALTVFSSNLTGVIYDWLGWDRNSWLLGTMGSLARYGAVFVFDALVLMAMHRYLAEVRVPRLRLLLGSVLGALALLGLKILGTTLLGGATSNPLLTSFALFIGVLLWFNFVCRVLLLTASWIATGLDKHLGLPQIQSSEKIRRRAVVSR